MRWLLLKDLQILRRSPLQAVLLVVYPILIAVLVGFAISREPGKPRVAFLNQIPSGTRVTVGGQQLPSVGVDERICRRVECVRVKSRREAIEAVRSGDVLAALVLPADLVERINSLSTLSPGTPKVEVIVNEEDPVKAQPRRRPDQLAAGAGEPADRTTDRGRRRALPQPRRQRRQLRRDRPDVPDPRHARQRQDPRSAAAGAAGGAAAQLLDQAIRFAILRTKTSTSPLL